VSLGHDAVMIKIRPQIIQGGMGIGVSNWVLAREVSRHGQLGVVSGTAINSVLVRRLQDGDRDGSQRRALAAFPFPGVAQKILEDYFILGGKEPEAPYKRAGFFSLKSAMNLLQLNVAASFCEVWLAKQGHQNPVGINLLEKIQLPNLSALYGAMLANVDVVIMGAGIPREIPGCLDLFSKNQKARLKIPVEGSEEDHWTEFSPQEVFPQNTLTELPRPLFFPIVSSSVLAASLAKKSTGRVDGFIVEGPLAGGHNAPPRGPLKLNDLGEPIYGDRDIVDFEALKQLGLPFWIAGDYGTSEKLKAALALGAQGVQVGTAFAFTEESGLNPEIRQRVLTLVKTQKFPEHGFVFTDPRSSPTGFPFKAVRLTGTLSEKKVYDERQRICDLGYLRHTYKKSDGSIGQRCPAEPVKDYLAKGGLEADTIGRKCLCNALMSDIGLGQIQKWGLEQSLLTAGDDLNYLGRFLNHKCIYKAQDVLNDLLKA
jgi:NAD(P)H-dependent flavin oxidoreductase YrpB (nitropropane dioxygenase family)